MGLWLHIIAYKRKTRSLCFFTFIKIYEFIVRKLWVYYSQYLCCLFFPSSSLILQLLIRCCLHSAMMMSALLCCNSKKASSLMRLIPSIHVVPNQLHGSLKKETLTPAHGMVSSAMKTKVVSSRLTSRVAASRVLSTLAAAFSRLSILSGLIFLLTTSMVLKSHLLTFRVYLIKPLFCCFS